MTPQKGIFALTTYHNTIIHVLETHNDLVVTAAPRSPLSLKNGAQLPDWSTFSIYPVPDAPERGSSVKLVALLCLGSPLAHVEQ